MTKEKTARPAIDPATRARLRTHVKNASRGAFSLSVSCDEIINLLDALDDREATIAKAVQEIVKLRTASLSRKALAVVEAARTASLNDTDEAHRALCVALSDYDSTKGCSDG